MSGNKNIEYFYLWTLIRNISHLIGKIRDRELSQYGLTVMQSAALYMVNAYGERATPANIARALFRETTTVSNLLIRMEQQGLVKRIEDRRRRGQIKVVLTRAGERALRDSRQRESIKRIMSQLDNGQIQRLRADLGELRKVALQELGLSPVNPHLPDSDQ
ncbi:MAG: MarR family transcriptional regulator [Chloroflexota bacterium]